MPPTIRRQIRLASDAPVYEFRHNRKTGNIRVVIDMDIPPDEADKIFQIVRKIDT